jgi:hypothetical protein
MDQPDPNRRERGGGPSRGRGHGRQGRGERKAFTPSTEAKALLGHVSVGLAELPQRQRSWVLAAIQRQYFPSFVPAKAGFKPRKGKSGPGSKSSQVNSALAATQEGKAWASLQEEVKQFRAENPDRDQLLPEDLHLRRAAALAAWRKCRSELRAQLGWVPPNREESPSDPSNEGDGNTPQGSVERKEE